MDESYSSEFSNDSDITALIGALMPVRETLLLHKGELSLTEWLHLVLRVKESIIRHPERLLSSDILMIQHLEKMIEELFYQFLKEEILR